MACSHSRWQRRCSTACGRGAHRCSRLRCAVPGRAARRARRRWQCLPTRVVRRGLAAPACPVRACRTSCAATPSPHPRFAAAACHGRLAALGCFADLTRGRLSQELHRRTRPAVLQARNRARLSWQSWVKCRMQMSGEPCSAKNSRTATIPPCSTSPLSCRWGAVQPRVQPSSQVFRYRIS